MDLQKLLSDDPSEVRSYLRAKFKSLSRFRYSKNSRKQKCIKYYLAVDGSEHAQEIIEVLYLEFFHDNFPVEEAEMVARAAVEASQRMNPDDWLDLQHDKVQEVKKVLAELQQWKESQEWQMGAMFYNQLVARVAFVDDKLCDDVQYGHEFSAALKSEANTSVAITAKEIEAKFDLMVGFKQTASCSFEVRDEDWGTVNGKLEESFKAGLWASGGAKASMDKMGFSAELQASIAIGLQLDIEAELTWSKDKHQVELGGEASVFVGGRVQAEMKLSVSAIKGLEASIKAGAFAGFSAEAKGHCTYSYDGQAIIAVEATAAVTFGAGAEFEASIKAPIFGPTEISFKASLTLGFGTAVGTKAVVNFSEASLALSTELQKVVEWRTLAKGYQMDLMNQDAKNLYYLNKSIRRMGSELASTQNTIETYHRVPEEKRGLLAG